MNNSLCNLIIFIAGINYCTGKIPDDYAISSYRHMIGGFDFLLI